MLFVLALIAYAFYSKSWAVFGLAGVFTILTGLMLVSGEPIEYATGEFTIVESFNDDANMTRVVPDSNSFSALTSEPIWMWGNLMMYGGFVFIIFSFLLAVRIIVERGENEFGEI